MSCGICCEEFNKSTKKPINCFNCSYEYCTKCLKRYLLEINIMPQCISCSANYDKAFLAQILPSTFVNGELRQKISDILFEQERTLIELQIEQTRKEEYAERERQKTYNELIDAQCAKILETLPTDEVELTSALAAHLGYHSMSASIWRECQIYYLRYTRQKLMDLSPLPNIVKLLNVYTQIRPVPQNFIDNINIQVHIIDDIEVPTPTITKFIHKCLNTKCEGYLSSKWKCGTCETTFCCHCREIKNINHVCDPAILASVEAIKEEAKPCPQCKEYISKVSGCNQMWCINCHISFDWVTGKQVHGIIHNPHYFEWTHRPRADRPCELDPASTEQIGMPTLLAEIAEVRNLADVMHPTYDDTTNHIHRMRYIEDNDLVKFKNSIYSKYKLYHRDRDLKACLDMLAVCATDLVSLLPSNADTFVEELKKLIEHFKENVNKINKIYKTATTLYLQILLN